MERKEIMKDIKETLNDKEFMLLLSEEDENKLVLLKKIVEDFKILELLKLHIYECLSAMSNTTNYCLSPFTSKECEKIKNWLEGKR